MENNTKFLRISKEDIPGGWAANASFGLTKTAAPFLLIITDRKDGLQDMLLFQKQDNHVSFLGQRCLQFHLGQHLAQKLTASIFLQLQIRRHIPNRTVQNIIRDYASLFQPSDVATSVFRELETLLSQQASISYGKILTLVQKLTSECKMHFSSYEHFFSNSGLYNSMLHFFNASYMAWNGIVRMIGDFLQEQAAWGNATAGDIQIVFYGSMMTLASICEPQMAKNQMMQFTPASKQLLYRKTSEMLQETVTKRNWRLFMAVADYPFEQVLIEAYEKNRSARAEIQKNQKSSVSIFTEDVFCLPGSACAYAGKRGGASLAFVRGQQPEEAPGFLVPPYSKQFAAQIAQGIVRPLKEEWVKRGNGWEFALEYAFRNEVYRIKPHLFENVRMIPEAEMPAIIFAKKKEFESLCISLDGGRYRVDLFHGNKQKDVVLMENGMSECYVQIYDDYTYLMQLKISLV